MFLIFDTETTGLPKRWKAPISDTDNWPRCVQIAWQLHDQNGVMVSNKEFIVSPEGFTIPYESEQIHGISTQLATDKGIPLREVLNHFQSDLKQTKYVVGHNVSFDLNIMGAEFFREKVATQLNSLPVIDTCTELTATLCQLPGGRGGKFKLPTLTELYVFLFHSSFAEAHNASADVEATTRVFLELVRKNIIKDETFVDLSETLQAKFPEGVPLEGIKHQNLKQLSTNLQLDEQIGKELNQENLSSNRDVLSDHTFVHLHNHSQYSVLQSTTRISELVEKTSEFQMPAVALTDTANMMGAFHFVKAVGNYNNSLSEEQPEKKHIKPILGCEFYVCENHLDRSQRDNGYQVVFLAKNKRGYHHLAKMSSIAFTKGFYYVPRIDRDIVEQYKEDLIVLSGNLYGEIPSKILNVGESQAEQALLWWKEQFKDDFYIELMRHGQEDETRVNQVLVNLTKKHEVKLVATNNTFYTEQKDANAHDILLCVKDGEKQATPIGRGRGYRYGLPNQEYYFKSSEAMKKLFEDVPEAIVSISEILDKIEEYELAREVLLPKFTIPSQFVDPEDEKDKGKRGENAYLRHLTYEGAKNRYKELSNELKERIDFELQVIENTGYPGYFLIVQDFIAAAREMGVSVGPGRGSAAGSAVAYCLKITNIDPIKYDLLFERFLNPDRVSLPDIDIDFDDEGRSKVMDYVIEKYGSNQVAQIITYGTMAAKSSIRDTARVLDLSLGEADRISKLVPNMKLKKIFELEEKALKDALRSDELLKVNELKNIADGDDLEAQTINQARILEGSLRNTGIHACGVIITPSDITDFVPVATAKDSDLYVTQFDNSVVENAGLLKMDFLGLKTLTLIKDTVKLIDYRHQIQLNPDEFPLDDQKTYELFQRGDTVGVFQYESAGMQKYLRELKPTVFEDLIAMNALYRPGPLEYIPSFVLRKNGQEPISYDLDAMEEYLKETYGITVYQEQVMLLSQKLANFTKGEADLLRKAMGKKIFSLLEQLKPKFLDGGQTNGHDREILEKIWKDWEAFASYAFNKSHSTCYAWIAYQTAYLKAHYPAEYMAAVLSNNMNDIKQVTFFMEECKRANIPVLGPDVNESFYKFTVNDQNAIRFGMGAIKGVGANAVATIVENRKESPYKSIFDLAKRIDLRSANKKSFESLVLAGGMDSFSNTHRAQYFQDSGDGVTFLEKVIKFGSKYQDNLNSSQVSLFEGSTEDTIAEPEIPPCEPWGTLHALKQEREVVGIYISAHPLDDFKVVLNSFCNASVDVFADLTPLLNRELTLGGIVGDVQHRVSKNGKGWAIFTLEDYTNSYDFRIFGEEYLKFKHFLVTNNFVYIKVFVKEGWVNRETGKKGDPRLQFNAFQQLQDTLSSNSKKITLQLNINEFDEDKLDDLKGVLKLHKGDRPVDIAFFEMEKQLKLVMHSRNQKVAITENLLTDLTDSNFHYKLN